jgi:hypothetical protein
MALDFGAQEFVDLDRHALDDAGGVDLVFDVIGGDIQQRSARCRDGADQRGRPWVSAAAHQVVMFTPTHGLAAMTKIVDKQRSRSTNPTGRP